MIAILNVAALVAVALAVLRYGADSRSSGDPTGRDPGWSSAPRRDHTPAEDLRLLAALARRVTAHRRAWELFDDALRPWERSARPHPGPARGAPSLG